MVKLDISIKAPDLNQKINELDELAHPLQSEKNYFFALH
jgi:hypothetical protein